MASHGQEESRSSDGCSAADACAGCIAGESAKINPQRKRIAGRCQTSRVSLYPNLEIGQRPVNTQDTQRAAGLTIFNSSVHVRTDQEIPLPEITEDPEVKPSLIGSL